MLELTGIDVLLRAVPFIYWGIAAVALALAVFLPKRLRYKVIAVAVVVVLFGFPPANRHWEIQKQRQAAMEAWIYFKKKCDAESGKKVFKTFKDVNSVLVVKPLPPATGEDLYDQFWRGDPYSNATPVSDRGVSVAGMLIERSVRLDGTPQKGFPAVEVRLDEAGGVRYQRIVLSPDGGKRLITNVQKPASRFGISWEDISTDEDRKYWVAGSRLRITDLADGSVVAERIGFYIERGRGSRAGQRLPWLTGRGPDTTCPPLLAPDYEDQWFVLSVLRSTDEKSSGK